jgi:hypothetical protein
VVGRRGFLAAVLALPVTAACRPKRRRPAAVPTRPVADPDAAILAAARAEELALLAAYDALLTARPTLRIRLAPLRAHHAAHLTALRETPESPAPAPSPAPASRDVLAAERRAAAARRADAERATPVRAGLLASIGASEAAHAAVLPALLA